MKPGNYDIMKDRMRELFLDYDQESMIRTYDLKTDEQYLYFTMFSRGYRIRRDTGDVTRSADGFKTEQPADVNEAGTLYDLLCREPGSLQMTGDFVTVESLSSLQSAASAHKLGEGMYAREAKLFDRNPGALRRACEKLGGLPEGKGDVAFRIPVFDFMDMKLSFWASDDEFPAELKFYWDRSILRFLHYETVYYACYVLVTQLLEEIQG